MSRDAARLGALSRDMLRSMRRLRRDLRSCELCQCAESCETLRSFNAQVQAALQEISDEYNLIPFTNGDPP